MKRNKSFYSKKYLKQNPTLHLEDAIFKFQALIGIFDFYLDKTKKKSIRLIDIGSGLGLIPSLIKTYYASRGIKVECTINDISPEIIKKAKKSFPDHKYLIGDLRKLKIKEKFDLALLIDVVEHLDHPEQFIENLSHKCDHAIFQTPMQDALFFNLINFFSKGNLRRGFTNQFGHVNFFYYSSYKKIITENFKFKIMKHYFADTFSHYLRSNNLKRPSFKGRLFFTCGQQINKISPALSARLFCDAAIDLVDFKK